MGLIDFLLRQECVITPWIREGNGEDIYGEPETRACRVQVGRELESTYVNPDGQMDQVRHRTKMFCVGEPIPERSIVECDGETFTVTRCYRAYGFIGDHLEVVME